MTTSAKADHLRVLWGEIGQFIQSCKYPLDSAFGGPLKINHQELRKVYKGRMCPKSYVKAMVASPDTIAAMQGHHIANIGDGIPRSLFVSDESSSVPDEYYGKACTWFNRAFIFGNTWNCDNFFYRGIEGGDQYSEDGKRCYRKVIRIRAVDSPNVRYAMEQIALGVEPTGEMLVPGVKSYDEYVKNRATWDLHQQCVALDAEFYKGAEAMMFPREWLMRAQGAALVNACRNSPAEAIGIDPAEGGDETAMAAVNRYGVKELVSRKTPNTAVITSEALAFVRKHQVPAGKVCFDRGGGGKQHADRLRADHGMNVRTVAFGEGVVPDPRRGKAFVPERIDMREDRYQYVNRRAEMYGELRLLLDPCEGPRAFGLMGSEGFAIPSDSIALVELHRQLGPIPLWYDGEGRLKLPKKNKRTDAANDNEVTLHKLLGCSPDEADAVVLAVHGMVHKPARAKVTAV